MSGRPGWLDDSLEEEWVEPDEVDMSIEHDEDKRDLHPLSKSVLVSPVAGSQATRDGLRASQHVHQLLGVSNQPRHVSASGSSVTAVPSSPGTPPPASPSPREGTFLIREDIQHQPLTPALNRAGFQFGKGKGNGRGKQFEAFTKSMFTPLALEKMFDPPSPPLSRTKPSDSDTPTTKSPKLQSPLIPLPNPSSRPLAHVNSPSRPRERPMAAHPLRAVISPEQGNDAADDWDEIVASDIPNLLAFNGRVPSSKFTFHITHEPQAMASSTPRAKPSHSTPSPNSRAPKPAPANKTPSGLKLFQTFDTYTKDHLSALVESIDVKSSPPDLGDSDGDSVVYGRNAKRIRLSPPERQGMTAGGTIRSSLSAGEKLSPERPPVSRPNSRTGPRDFLGESRSLMDQIRNNRSFSLTTTMSRRDPQGLSLVEEDDDDQVEGTPLPAAAAKRAPYALQAASLMAQIKFDMKGAENENPRLDTISSTQGGSGRWESVSSIHDSLNKLSIHGQDQQQVDRMRSASPPTILIEQSSPTVSLPELPLPLKQEPARESSISSRRSSLSQSTNSQQRAGGPRSDTIPLHPAVPMPLTSSSSRVPTMTTVPSSSRFSVVSGGVGQRLGSGSSIGASTAATSNSQMSVGSNMKRAGSPSAPRMRTIAPEEVGPISRVGNMEWDPVRMMWKKDRVLSNSLKRDRTMADAEEEQSANEEEEEVDDDITEDVFRDIESLRDVTTTGSLNLRRSMGSLANSRASANSSRRPHDTHPETRRDLSHQYEDDGTDDDLPASPGEVQQPYESLAEERLKGDISEDGFEQEYPDDEAAESRFEESESEFVSGVADPEGGRTPSFLSVSGEEGQDLDELSKASIISGETSPADLQRNFESTFSDEEEPYEEAGDEASVEQTPGPSRQASAARFAPAPDTPHPNHASETPRPILIPSQSTPHPFGHAAPRSRPPLPLVAPRSALKQTPSPANFHPATPASRGHYSSAHRRSVSFSDGRTDGKMLNVSISQLAHGDAASEENSTEDSDSHGMAQGGGGGSYAQSVRTRRIEGMLAALEEASVEDSMSTKSNAQHGRPDTSGLVPLSARSSTFSRSRSDGVALSRVELPLSAQSDSLFDEDEEGQDDQVVRHREPAGGLANQTILTEASFVITQDRLVQAITQVHPYEAHWEDLPEIKLVGFGIESVTRMKDYLPSVMNLDLHQNQLSYLTGVPPLVRALRVSNNQLTSVTAYSHLRNLEFLDISYNQVDSLTQLASLSRLQDLRADGNSIRSLEGLEQMTSLAKLSLKKNRISQINFGEISWPRLESLDLGANSLGSLKGLSKLQRLSMLNIDHNKIASLEASRVMTRLRILRASGNRLTELHVASFVHLRTLYLDGNRLRHVHDLDKLPKLENLSLRNQAGGHLSIGPTDVQDVKRLYLSGNPLVDLNFLSTPCYNLLYLELAGCRISTLPSNFPNVVPNLRMLNLNYNFISNAKDGNVCGIVS